MRLMNIIATRTCSPSHNLSTTDSMGRWTTACFAPQQFGKRILLFDSCKTVQMLILFLPSLTRYAAALNGSLIPCRRHIVGMLAHLCGLCVVGALWPHCVQYMWVHNFVILCLLQWCGCHINGKWECSRASVDVFLGNVDSIVEIALFYHYLEIGTFPNKAYSPIRYNRLFIR